MILELVGVEPPSGDILGTIGLFLSGAGSVLTGWLAIRYERKRSEKDCENRIKALFAGAKMRDDIDKSKEDMLG